MKRQFIRTGPAPVGKTQTNCRLARLYPEIYDNIQKVLSQVKRSPRPNRLDHRGYTYSTHVQVEPARSTRGRLNMKVDGDERILDPETLQKLLGRKKLTYSGIPFMAHIDITHPSYKTVNRTSIVMSPSELPA